MSDKNKQNMVKARLLVLSNRYREHMIEFTWMDLREEPAYFFIERYRTGELDAKLLPPREVDRFFDDITRTLECYPTHDAAK